VMIRYQWALLDNSALKKLASTCQPLMKPDKGTFIMP